MHPKEWEGASVVALTPAEARRAGIALPDAQARARGAVEIRGDSMILR